MIYVFLQYLQAEPGKKPVSVAMNFPRAPVLPRLAVFSPVKRPMWRRFKKSFSQIKAKKKKSNGQLEMGTQITSAKSADMDQTAAPNHLILAISQWRTQRRAQLRDFPPIDGAGRFRRGLAHMKTNISNFLVLL